MEKWHAAKPNSIANGESRRRPSRRRRRKPPAAPPQYTKVFGDALVAECERDDRVVGITAAMNSGTGLNILQKAMPERYFDVGIAEQQAVLFAAGLALQGAKPVVAIYSTFLQRAYDQIVHDVCLQRAERRLRDGPRRPRGRRRADAPRRVRHRLPALPAEHRADGAARRGDARAHAAHRARDDDGPVAMRYPRGEAVGVALPDEPEGDRDRHRRDPARGRARRARGLRHRRAEGARGGGHARRAAACAPRSPTRASPSRSTPACSPSSPPSTTCSSPSRRAFWPAASAPPSGSASPRAGCAPRILRVGLPDRYVTHGGPEAPPRGGRVHRRAHRRAHRGRGAGPPRLARQRLSRRAP